MALIGIVTGTDGVHRVVGAEGLSRAPGAKPLKPWLVDAIRAVEEMPLEIIPERLSDDALIALDLEGLVCLRPTIPATPKSQAEVALASRDRKRLGPRKTSEQIRRERSEAAKRGASWM